MEQLVIFGAATVVAFIIGFIMGRMDEKKLIANSVNAGISAGLQMEMLAQQQGTSLIPPSMLPRVHHVPVEDEPKSEFKWGFHK